MCFVDSINYVPESTYPCKSLSSGLCVQVGVVELGWGTQLLASKTCMIGKIENIKTLFCFFFF